MKNLKIGLVIPWRAEQSRVTAFRVCLDFYNNNFPYFKKYIVDSVGAEFNLAQAKNIGVEKAISEGCDVVVVSDADIIPNKKLIKKAIKKAYRDEIAVQPFNKHFELDQKTSDQFIRGAVSRKEVRSNSTMFLHHSGVLVVLTPKVFKDLNGWDERMGYSGEDVAFECSHVAIYGQKYFRFIGNMYSLWHERDFSIREKYKKHLEKNYLDPLITKEQMKKTISGNRINTK